MCLKIYDVFLTCGPFVTWFFWFPGMLPCYLDKLVVRGVIVSFLLLFHG